METANKMTNLQRELVKLFKYDLKEGQLLEIKNILSKYFADKATREMDRLWDEKNWTQETMKRVG